MSTKSGQPGEFALSLTEEERAELLQLLEQSLKETRVEMHRTHTPDFRDKVHHQEDLYRGLIDKLRQVGS